MVFGRDVWIEPRPAREGEFQFPLGIRWCSDYAGEHMVTDYKINFNSPWELDGVRTCLGLPAPSRL